MTSKAKTGRSRPKVLMVDDNALLRFTTGELLNQAGYEVETAANAEEALLLVQLIQWDGLVMDVDLPDLNGVKLYARILQTTGCHRLPVVFFTARADKALQSGLGHVPWARLVPKPCSGVQLLAALEQCLRTDVEAGPAAGC